MNLRLILMASGLAAVCGLGVASCGNDADNDADASIVNIEKGVAPAVITTEAVNSNAAEADVKPVGIIGGTEIVETVEEQQESEPGNDNAEKPSEEKKSQIE